MSLGRPTGPPIDSASVVAPNDCLQGKNITLSRPLGPRELGYLVQRGSLGYTDSFTILSLECSGGRAIGDDEVVVAYAALCVCHPILASHVSNASSFPRLEVHWPLTKAHAIREARVRIGFQTFEDQRLAAASLGEVWLNTPPEDQLDVRYNTCELCWWRDADAASGRYILALRTTHFVTDGRRRLNVLRLFLDVLATPERAQELLLAHFVPSRPARAIPSALEDLFANLSTYSSDELAQGKAALDAIIRFSGKPMFGIPPDGSGDDDKVIGRLIRKVWSRDDTARILKVCKANEVTVTHLISAANLLAVATHPQGRSGLCDEPQECDDDMLYFRFVQALDTTAKTHERERETAVRVIDYTIFVTILRSVAAGPVTPVQTWDVARQVKEKNDQFVQSPYLPHFVHRLPDLWGQYKPEEALFMPFVSSMGDLKDLLPARYAFTAGVGHNSLKETKTGAEIRITDMTVAGRVIGASVAVFLVYTFDGRLHLQFKYNSTRVSDALVRPWLRRVIEFITVATNVTDGNEA